MSAIQMSQLELATAIPAGSLHMVEMGDGSGTQVVTQETLVKETGKSLKVGDLTELETEDKTSLVGAINETKKSGGGSVDIMKTPEEIEANTEPDKAAGALAMKEMFGALNDKLGLETREDPNDPTQAQWKNSEGDWINFKKGGSSSILYIGAIGSSHDVKEKLPNYKNLTKDNFKVILSSVSANAGSGSVISSRNYNIGISYNSETGMVSSSIAATPTGSVGPTAGFSGGIYYVG